MTSRLLEPGYRFWRGARSMILERDGLLWTYTSMSATSRNKATTIARIKVTRKFLLFMSWPKPRETFFLRRKGTISTSKYWGSIWSKTQFLEYSSIFTFSNLNWNAFWSTWSSSISAYSFWRSSVVRSKEASCSSWQTNTSWWSDYLKRARSSRFEKSLRRR